MNNLDENEHEDSEDVIFPIKDALLDPGMNKSFIVPPIELPSGMLDSMRDSLFVPPIKIPSGMLDSMRDSLFVPPIELPSGMLDSMRDSLFVPPIKIPSGMLDFSTVFNSTFNGIDIEHLFSLVAQLDPLKLFGYEKSSFLPVYRLGLSDDIAKKKLVKNILKNEDVIIREAKTSLQSIPTCDPLRPLFKEAIKSAEKNRYRAAQALLAQVYGLIRDTRFTGLIGIQNQVMSYMKESHEITLPSVDFQKPEELKYFVEYIVETHTKNDVSLALMTLYAFSNTKNHPTGHNPKHYPSRNAMTHKSPAYYSKYNCLCFLLYVSEIFDLIYEVESIPNSLILAKKNWPL